MNRAPPDCRQRTLARVLPLIALGALACTDDGKPVLAATDSATPQPGSRVVTRRAGGRVASADGRAAVDVPPGAVASDTEIAIQEAATYPADGALVANTAYEFTPHGLLFTVPVVLTLKYDDAGVPPGRREASLRVHKVVDGAWAEQPNGGVDDGSNVASVEVRSFSVFGVLATGGTDAGGPIDGAGGASGTGGSPGSGGGGGSGGDGGVDGGGATGSGGMGGNAGADGGPLRGAPLGTGVWNDSPNDKGMTAIGGEVFWTNNSPSGGVYRCSLQGCGSPTPYVSTGGNPGAILVHGAHIYWLEGRSIMRCTTTGCVTPETIFTSPTSDLSAPMAYQLATDGQSVFFVGSSWYRQISEIYTCAVSGCSPTLMTDYYPLYGSGQSIGGFATDGTTLYWGTNAPSLSRRTLEGCATAGCGQSPSVLTQGTYVFSLIARGGRLVWKTGQSPFTIGQCSLPACTDASTVTTALSNSVSSEIVSDGETVYWLEPDRFSVMRCTLPTCSEPVVFANNGGGAVMPPMAVDETHVYFMGNDGGGRVLLAAPK